VGLVCTRVCGALYNLEFHVTYIKQFVWRVHLANSSTLGKNTEDSLMKIQKLSPFWTEPTI